MAGSPKKVGGKEVVAGSTQFGLSVYTGSTPGFPPNFWHLACRSPAHPGEPLTDGQAKRRAAKKRNEPDKTSKAKPLKERIQTLSPKPSAEFFLDTESAWP
jgi:hypothetical protein